MTTGLKWIFIAIAMCGFTITQANAANMYGPYQVKSLFAESANTAGFFVVEGLPQCLYGLMYIDLSSAAGKGQFALLTSAKMGGWKITRIDYTQSANGACWLGGVHVE